MPGRRGEITIGSEQVATATDAKGADDQVISLMYADAEVGRMAVMIGREDDKVRIQSCLTYQQRSKEYSQNVSQYFRLHTKGQRRDRSCVSSEDPVGEKVALQRIFRARYLNHVELSEVRPQSGDREAKQFLWEIVLRSALIHFPHHPYCKTCIEKDVLWDAKKATRFVRHLENRCWPLLQFHTFG